MIVTDDGSPPDVVEQLHILGVDRLIISDEGNTGLGANTNRGLRAATGDYILHHQDDFLISTSESFIERSIQIMERHPNVGLVRLHHSTPFSVREDYALPDGTIYSILGFDQPPLKNRIYIYSDHPHLKRADFHEKAGYFAEGLGVGQTEDEFCYRFLANRAYQVATFWRTDLFSNLGIGKSTRADRRRVKLRARLNQTSIGRCLVGTYGRLPEGVRKKLK